MSNLNKYERPAKRDLGPDTLTRQDKIDFLFDEHYDALKMEFDTQNEEGARWNSISEMLEYSDIDDLACNCDIVFPGEE